MHLHPVTGGHIRCGGIGILMARALGDGRSTRANEVTKVGVALTYGGLGMVSACLYFFMQVFASIASYDPEVQGLLIGCGELASAALILS